MWNFMWMKGRDEKGVATVEWIGLALVIVSIMAVVAGAMRSVDGSKVAAKVMDSIARMVDRVQK